MEAFKQMNLMRLNSEESFTQEYTQLACYGFIHLKKVLSTAALIEVRHALDYAFSDASSGRTNSLLEHGEAGDHLGAIQEMNHLLKILPALKRSPLLAECNDLVNRILSRRTMPSFDHAIYKQPMSGSVHWHQDQAYKDKVKKMQSVHVWIPLQDTVPSMGCMQYVPGSHRLGNLRHQRSATAHTLFAKLDGRACEDAVQVTASLGDVIIHLPQTLHSSLPNHSGEIRKAWIVHFSPYGYWEPLLPQNLLWYAQKKMRLLSLALGRRLDDQESDK
ncbi:phytanoyl-CoA dioxygenase family protein [Marinobacter sp. SS13-12]|uniref:phytanoyl-CoA dioxygenase family protein n=1 Tax=Marinobacter sp. SS13-12 TaxID=3050451 RepID=UPI002552C16F|nr:phytanoyl-CoA dioxygenase family protein [Marinobacter sp. SS13-12]MDK8465524.1 phytanoyl-CoA dioxygenase family protein [Marinobacter sp. SS13-12]